MSRRALVIEDDHDIAELVKTALGRERFTVTLAHDGTSGYERAIKDTPDVVILDIMLPGVDGLELCRYLRQNERTAHIPILILSAKSEEVDRVLGLEIGADDYLTKPFSPRELMARIKALLRRKDRQSEAGDVIIRGPLSIDIARHEVTMHGRVVELSAKEFNLLLCLVRGQGRVYSRDQLLARVWGDDYVGGSRTVDVHIRHIREKLPAAAAHIVTVKSVGYKFVDQAPIASAAGAASATGAASDADSE